MSNLLEEIEAAEDNLSQVQRVRNEYGVKVRDLKQHKRELDERARGLSATDAGKDDALKQAAELDYLIKAYENELAEIKEDEAEAKKAVQKLKDRQAAADEIELASKDRDAVLQAASEYVDAYTRLTSLSLPGGRRYKTRRLYNTGQEVSDIIDGHRSSKAGHINKAEIIGRINNDFDNAKKEIRREISGR